MHLGYWRLREEPFSRGLDPRAYVPSSTHEEALARLNYIVESQRRLGLLLGSPGSGKSFVLSVLARQLRGAPGQVVRLSLQGLSPQEFLWALAARLGLYPETTSTCFQLWRQLGDRLAENRFQRLPTVFLLDDADLASQQTLEQVERLARIEPTSPNYVAIVVAGQQHQAAHLGRQLLELAELRIDLAAWDLGDTELYVQTSLARAGQNPNYPVFRPEALLRLHELSGGAVRRVTLLAELALLAAAGGKLPQVDAHTIDAVYDELGVMDAFGSVHSLA